MSPRKIGVTELVLRDAHQSLLATRMAMEDMVDACADIDAAGFWSVECWGGATFDSCIRFLNEDPWERLRTFRKLLPNLGGLDISPIFAFLAIKLLDMLVVNNLATMTHMPNILRMLI